MLTLRLTTRCTLGVTGEAIKHRNEAMKITDSLLYLILHQSVMIWVQFWTDREMKATPLKRGKKPKI